MAKQHSFHIPVMGIGYTIDTPLNVAHLGMDSVISLVDDILIEKLRKMYSEKFEIPYKEITDKIELRKNQINYTITVLDIPQNRVGAKLVDIYRVDTTPKSAFESQELLKFAKDYYRKKGTGRPTKKDRRNIDEIYRDNEE